MLVYILKFSACLGIFLAFYKFFLERENMHQFKRFYLIGTILISFSIPFVTFTQYIEPVVLDKTIQTTQAVVSQSLDIYKAATTNYLPLLLWSLYGLGVLLFGIKFLTNLSKIILKINRNPKHKSLYAINVLLQDLVTPHTFFSYIFLNKHKYETQQIPKEVLLHEETHAKQKHSIDIILVEVLQVIFWFNPLIYLIKNSIKLNHEFLADKAVLKEGVQPTNYQQIILAFSTNQREPQLANAINYSSIKKRITVMKTHTSKQKIWFRSLVLLPLLTLTLYSFSEHKKVVKEIIPEASVNGEVTPLSNSSTNHTARSIELEILNDGSYMIDNIMATKSTLVTVVNTLHQDITSEVRNKIMNIHISSSNEISNKDVWHIYNSLLDYGFYRMVTPTQEIILGKGNTPFAINNTESEVSSKELAKYNRLAKLYNKQPEATRVIPFENLAQIETIYHKMSSTQKASAEPFPNCPPQLSFQKNTEKQDGASREQMKEYERLAKHYNSLPDNQRIIKQKDVVRMKYIYGLMNAKQKKDAEPFPNIPPPPAPEALNPNLPPPPPPPIPDNATKEQKEKYKKVIEEYNKKYTIKDGMVSENPPPPPPPIPDNATPEQRKKYEEATKLYKLPAEKNEGSRVRELRSKEDISRLRKDKLAYQEARLAKIKTDKGELTRVRELRSEEEVLKLKKEKLAYKEARVAKLKTDKGELARIKEIQTPKPPRSPLDHVIDMAKKDAIFYLEGKEISSDDAIKALKKNKSLNIETIGSDSRQPKVYITKKPVVIDN
ncbi:MAG: hypothetical protein DA407_02870 [Bacteroidetes bacterium]|nr:MAG: hypothetical protein DA407_02870 [Bacteroidota bacterium]